MRLAAAGLACSASFGLKSGQQCSWRSEKALTASPRPLRYTATMRRLTSIAVCSFIAACTAGCSSDPVHTPQQLIQAIKSGDAVEVAFYGTKSKVLLSPEQRGHMESALSESNLKPIRVDYKMEAVANIIVREKGKDIARLHVYEGDVISFHQKYFKMVSNPIATLILEYRR